MSIVVGLVGFVLWMAVSAYAVVAAICISEVIPDLPPAVAAVLTLWPRLGLPLLLLFDSDRLETRYYRSPLAVRGVFYAICGALAPGVAAALYAIVRYKIKSKQWEVVGHIDRESLPLY